MDSFCPQDGSLSVIPRDCRGSVDFSLTFENYILVLIPAAALLILAPIRLSSVWNQSIKVVSPTILYALKTFASLCFVGANLILLITSTKLEKTIWRSSQVTASTLTFVSSLLCLVLSYVEHHRSIRPSVLLQLYLLIAVIVQAVHLRSVWLRGASTMLQVVCCAQLGSTASFLAAESCQKGGILISGKRHSPQDVNDIFSQRLFLWLNDLFMTGYTRILSPPDLFSIDEDLASQHTQRAFSLAWLLHSRRVIDLHLYLILALSLRKYFLFPIIPRLCMIGVNLAQPFFIGRLVSYIEYPENARPNEGRLLVLASLLIYTISALFSCWYWQSINRFQTKIRSTLITAIHDKALRARPSSEFSPLMLMNVDVDRVVVGIRFQHEVWAVLLLMSISLYLIKLQMGLTFLSPLILMVIVLAVISHNGAVIAPQQKTWLAATQKRVTFVTGIIASMKNIKLMGLVRQVEKMGASLRQEEVFEQRNIRRNALLNLILSLMSYQFCIVALFSTYAVKIHFGGPALTISTLFYTIALFGIFANPLIDAIQTFPELLQALAAMSRIQQYLNFEDHQDPRQESDIIDNYIAPPPSAGVSNVEVASVADLSAGYENNEGVLKALNLSFLQSQMHMVIGPVGAGKSTLLKTLIGETKINAGTVSLASFDTSFCEQPPWLFSGTVKANIICETEWNATWFSHVAWACGLDEDFREMPKGADSQAGDDGTALSGGQKNRISLARAIYSRKRLFIADDILSGLDTRTEALVFGRVFGPSGLLRKMGTTTILATHSVGWLKYADHTVILDSGRVAYQGPPASIPEKFSGLISHSSSIKDEDYDVSPAIVDANAFEEELVSVPIVSRNPSVYLTYFDSFGMKLFIGWALFGVFPYTTRIMQTVILQWWAEKKSSAPDILKTYPSLLAGAVVFELLTLAGYLVVFLIVMAPKSSIYLHALQWKSFVEVAYSSWHKLGSGNIANRFSQDMALVDMDLLLSCLNICSEVMLLAASIGIVTVASPYIAACYPVIIGLMFLIQKVYLRTSTQLRIMDLEAKTPLCSHFLETASGVVTISAFGWTEANRAKAQGLLDKSQAPFYLLLSIQQWLSLVLNFLVAGLITTLVAITVSEPNPGKVGLIGTALINLMNLGDYLKNFVQQWTRFDTSLGAVVRIQDFCKQLQQEEQGQITPGPEWLKQGSIEIRKLTATYSEGADPILHNISLSIDPGKKVAICGRTGSGKSSLASAIFGLLHITSGRILADGVDITKVSQDRLRNSLVALPQDPFFLPGTVRDNLSLRGNPSDEAMIQALTKVNLLPRFDFLAETHSRPSPLDVELSPTDMLTRGQQQLFAMARATLCPGSVLVIDEATSGLDAESDRLVQALVRDAFPGSTVIAIAHRLNTILDFDLVVVMDKGKVVEVGHPVDLRDKEGGAFAALLRSGGM